MKKILILLATLCVGCGSALSTARTATIASGEVILTARVAVVEHRTTLIESFKAQARVVGGQDPDARVREYDRLVEAHRAEIDAPADAVDVASRGWRALRAVLAAWESGEDETVNWQRTATCVAAAISNLIVALESAHITLPPEVAQVAADLNQTAERMCGVLPGEWEVHGELEANP